MLKNWLTRAIEEHDVFLFLLGYRWLSLLPPLLALVLTRASDASPVLAFLAALADNAFLTIFHPRVNRMIVQLPALFAIDLIVVAALFALSGGTASPYYLYALSPLLGAAFFFQMRGALITASALTALYVAAISTAPVDLLYALTHVLSFFLIAVLFGYASILVRRIHRDRALLAQSHATLERTNRELQSIHNLALTMQSSAVDVADVQEIILTTITNEMGFERAMMAMMDPERNVLIGWLTHYLREGAQAPSGLFHTMEIPLQPESGAVAQTVLNRKPGYVADGLPPTNVPVVNQRLKLKSYAILPLYMRDHPLGVLLVDNPGSGAPISAESMHSLELVADQAAIALGSTKLCIERAQRLAIEEERNRIAKEIHDTASQSLFGIVYTLDGCMKLLPERAAEVKVKLADLRDIAARTMNDLRHSVYDVWTGELSESEFKAELLAYLQKLGAPATLRVEIQVNGTFNGISPIVRKNILRIAEEGLANVVKHSGATRAVVTLDLLNQPPRLVVEDNGRGFQSSGNGQSRVGFGLVSTRERAHAIGGAAQVESRPGVGTRLEVQLLDRAPARVGMEGDADSACG
jgi:signal transduction histidine kinase